jgi:hypothetical protein
MQRRCAGAALAVALWSVCGGASQAAADPDEVQKLRSELQQTRDELDTTREELHDAKSSLFDLGQRVDALQAGATPAATPASSARLLPVNADNPAISFVVDTTFMWDYDQGVDFALRSGELFLSAPIDPFLRGWATLNGSSEEGFDIEEAAVVTTALPWNLTLTGGRFFADVGRLSHWHDEALPFTDRPPSLERIIGGESGAEGLQFSWLAPTDLFIQLTGGLYNSIGNERREALAEDGFEGQRGWGELTYLLHPSTYVDLSDTWNLEAGGTYATSPKNNRRNLWGVDVTLRHQPGTSGVYQGLVLGAEWLWNRETFQEMGGGSRRFHRDGGYAYLEAYFARRYSAGGRFDLSEEIEGPRDQQRSYSAFVTWMPSEFQRLRLQGDYVDGMGWNDQRVTLQWTAFIGSHKHGFQTR